MKRAFRFLIIFAFLSPVFFFAVSQAQAQFVPKQQLYQKAVKESEQKSNAEGFNAIINTSTAQWWANQMAGCIGAADECNSRYLSDTGALRFTTQMVAVAFTPQASTYTYVADLMQNMNIAQPAYAQGLGFSSLQPVLSLWKVSRDISYIFFVFLFLIIGFAIMFRKNLGGQTAVTVQQALPRIIVALLAVSFSYAIAGLLIDFMYLLMFFLISLFNRAGLASDNLFDLTAQNNILSQNIFEIYRRVLSTDIAGQVGGIVGDFVQNALETQLSGLATAVGWLSSLLATLIIFFAIIYAMFRTFFSLIKVYLEVILTIVFAPLILMMGAINGNAFGNWLKTLIFNLLVFPALLIFIVIGMMLTSAPGNSGPAALAVEFNNNGFVPPFLPGRGNATNIGLLVGIAAIMLLPEVASMLAKYKPTSIWQELGGQAFANVFQGNQYAAPITGLAAGSVAGAAVGGYMGLRNSQTLGQAIRQVPKGVLFGATDAQGVKRGGISRWAPTAYNFGQSVATQINKAREGKLLDPDTLTRQLESLRKSNQPDEKTHKETPTKTDSSG